MLSNTDLDFFSIVEHQLVSVHVQEAPGHEPSGRWCDSDGIDDAWDLRSSIHQGRTEAYMMGH